MIRNPIGHVATRVLREIEAMARIGDKDREKPILVIEEIRSTDWASLTFVGQRLELDLRLEGEAAIVNAALAQLIAALDTHEIAISGHFVADLQVRAGVAIGGCCQPLTVEALVLRD